MDIYKLDTAQTLQPFIHSTHWDWHPRFSKDGQQVAFFSSRNGPIDIWVTDKDASEHAAPVGNLDTRLLNWMSFSPDGKNIICQGSINDATGIYSIDIMTDSLRTIKGATHDYAYPEWLLDGQYLLRFQAIRELADMALQDRWDRRRNDY